MKPISIPRTIAQFSTGGSDIPSEHSNTRHNQSRKKENVLIIQGGDGSLGAFGCGGYKAPTKNVLRSISFLGRSILNTNRHLLLLLLPIILSDLRKHQKLHMSQNQTQRDSPLFQYLLPLPLPLQTLPSLGS